MVTTQAFPISMRRVNKKLRKIENPRAVSKLIELSEGNFVNLSTPSNSKEESGSAQIELVKLDTHQQSLNRKVPVSSPEKLDTLKYIMRLVEKAQPWLVLILFVSHFVFKRK